MFEHFAAEEIAVDDSTVFVRHAGRGPAVLLLHGFPQTHVMWADVAPVLARRFSVVCADLRGYGKSGCPASDPQHIAYSKRVMARELVGAMRRLGHQRFAVIGHDRGGRVAYRMALDHPGAVDALGVLDIVPTEDAWARADAELALSFWPWSFLAQPEPLPEKLVAAAPEAVIEDASTQWGSDKPVFSRAAFAAYVEVLRDADRVHAICEEYRAAATIDREHDRQDRRAGKHISCPTLVLWSRAGALEKWYDAEGGPLGLWRKWCALSEGTGVDAGHFFPEENPSLTASLIEEFLGRILG